MNPWIESAACQSRTPDICRACRTDRAFRESIVKAGKATDPEFVCPFGFTAEKLPGLGSLIERAVKPIAKMLRLDCLQPDGQLKPASPCAKRRDALNKLSG